MAGTMPKSLEELLSGTNAEGQQKTASDRSLPVGQEETDYATELAMLEKFAHQNFTQEDMLKIAASAKISADIHTDIQIEKLASAMPILVKVAMEQVLPKVLPAMLKAALQKVAVGDSEVISGGKASDTVEDHPHGQTMKEDELGKSDEPVGARQMAHAGRTEGASTRGGGDPASNQGEPTDNTHGNTVAPKVASNLAAQRLQQIVAQRLGAPAQKQAMADAMPGYGVGGPEGAGGGQEAMLQQLASKVASGTASPEEIALYQQLMAQAGGGGGMEHTASAPLSAAQKQELFAQMLRTRLG